MTPHETPIPGPAAAFAAALCAQLPVLETARLRLRAPHMGDFDAWAEILCGPAAQVVGGPVTRDEAFAEFASLGTWLLRGHGLWTVEPLAGGAPLGFVLIGFEPGDREPELVNLFRSTAEGQGHAFEAATAARDHARALGLPVLVGCIDPANTRSRRLTERLGAVRDGEVDDGEVRRHWTTDGRRPEVAGETMEKGQ